jgi:hypothetical protein
MSTVHKIIMILIRNRKFWEELTAHFPLIREGQHRKKVKIGGHTDTQTAKWIYKSTYLRGLNTWAERDDYTEVQTAPSRAHDQIFTTLWQLQSWFCVAHSLTRGRVCLLYVLLALASAVFLGYESLETRDHILLSQIWDFPFRCLLRLAGSRWRYSTPSPHELLVSRYIVSDRITHKNKTIV